MLGFQKWRVCNDSAAMAHCLRQWDERSLYCFILACLVLRLNLLILIQCAFFVVRWEDECYGFLPNVIIDVLFLSLIFLLHQHIGVISYLQYNAERQTAGSATLKGE